MLDGANNYPLMAIPFFVFAGEIMTEGGLSKRVVKLAQLIIGRVRGGLGYAAIVSSVIFAGLMGSSVGEAAALGSLLLPMMAQAGYKPGRAGGVIASGAILGPIIPPSTNFILLGATVGLSITKLFMIDPETVHKQLFLWYKTQIQKHIAYRLAALCPRIPWLTAVPTWRVRTMRRRWGSCTGSGVITLNTHLIKAPPQCLDYVLLHEIAHLQEHNHSQRYYAVLERLLPNWKAVRRELEAWSPLVLN